MNGKIQGNNYKTHEKLGGAVKITRNKFLPTHENAVKIDQALKAYDYKKSRRFHGSKAAANS